MTTTNTKPTAQERRALKRKEKKEAQAAADALRYYVERSAHVDPSVKEPYIVVYGNTSGWWDGKIYGWSNSLKDATKIAHELNQRKDEIVKQRKQQEQEQQRKQDEESATNRRAAPMSDKTAKDMETAISRYEAERWSELVAPQPTNTPRRAERTQTDDLK